MRVRLPETLFVLLLACFTLLVAGCARFDPQPLAPADTAAEFESRSLASPELRKFIEKNQRRDLIPWPPVAWDLPGLTLAAFYYHPSLDLARARWGAARAGELTAGARPNPTVGVGPQYTVNAARGVSPWLATVDLDIPIETAGKRGYRIARAQYESQAARLGIAAAAWQVRSALRSALFDHSQAGQRRTLLAGLCELQTKAIERLEQKRAAGALAATDIVASRIALQKLQLELAAAARQQSEGRARVAEAIGIPLAALDGVALPDLPVTTDGEARRLASLAARRLALTERADVLAALADYAAAQAALQLEIARQYPDIHLGPGYEYDQGENKWGISLSIELPLLNRNEGPIAEARARRDQSAAQFVALQARVVAEIDRALAAFQSSELHLARLEGMRKVQQEQLENLRRQLAAGAVERIDLVTAELEVGAAALARQEAVARRQQALGQVEDALQAPLDPDTLARLESNARVQPESTP